MPTIIYGIDLEGKFKPLDVREAIVRCFAKAHSRILEEACQYCPGISEEELKKFKEINSRELVRRYFQEVGGDFNNPDKDSLIKVCDKLKAFASNFRGEKIIRKNYSDIMRLINKL